MKHNTFYPFAMEDLSQIEQNKAYGYKPYGSTAVHAEQYAEKMLKDAIQAFGQYPPRTHNINVLMEELEIQGIPIDQELYNKGAFLSNLYFSVRYPQSGMATVGEDTAELAYCYALEIVGYYDSFYLDDEGNIVRTVELKPSQSKNRKLANQAPVSKKGLFGKSDNKGRKRFFR